MYRSVTGIALRTVRYSDSKAILSVWTAELGRISVNLPANNGRRASRVRALTMPLSPICLEVDVRPDRAIFNIRELRPAITIPGIGADPAKTITALFLADFLEVSLRDLQPEPLMTKFILESVSLLDRLPHITALNFNIYFLIRLTRFLGIEPDWVEPGTLFDLREGCFRLSAPLHNQYLDEASTAILRHLSRISPRNLVCFSFTRAERHRILDQLLLYYTMHHRPVLSLPSLAVIAEL